MACLQFINCFDTCPGYHPVLKGRADHTVAKGFDIHFFYGTKMLIGQTDFIGERDSGFGTVVISYTLLCGFGTIGNK